MLYSSLEIIFFPSSKELKASEQKAESAPNFTRVLKVDWLLNWKLSFLGTNDCLQLAMKFDQLMDAKSHHTLQNKYLVHFTI